MGNPKLDATVFVVDDDKLARESTCALVRSMGGRAMSYDSAEAFLQDYSPSEPGCLVTDMRMHGMSGAELQETLRDKGVQLPVIVLTAYAKTSLAVRVMRAGAITILDKPYEDDDLWDGIREAIRLDANWRRNDADRKLVQDRLKRLSGKELEVLELMIEGKPNKNVSRDLDISVRTVENRRRAVFDKMGVDSIAELVTLVMQARRKPTDDSRDALS